jgi:hypothetical protein
MRDAAPSQGSGGTEDAHLSRARIPASVLAMQVLGSGAKDKSNVRALSALGVDTGEIWVTRATADVRQARTAQHPAAATQPRETDKSRPPCATHASSSMPDASRQTLASPRHLGLDFALALRLALLGRLPRALVRGLALPLARTAGSERAAAAPQLLAIRCHHRLAAHCAVRRLRASFFPPPS